MCHKWFETIEARLEKYDIHDPETVGLYGFPQLRLNRFLASFSDDVKSKETYAAWLEQMRILNATSIRRRVANLPDKENLQELNNTPSGDSFDQALTKCGISLNSYSLNHPEHKKILLEQAKVPDSYQDWKRIIGLYPVARYFAKIGIDRLHRELSASIKMAINDLPLNGQLIRYRPPSSKFLSTDEIASILNSAYATGNTLGIPGLSQLHFQELTEHYAPVWEIDTRNDNDKLGVVRLDKNNHPSVDSSQPKVYTAQGYARWHGKVLLQLIYQIWLPAREKTGVFDLYGGALDSVIWRITLNPNGIPIAYDSIHGCGCYYLLFPGEGYRAISPSDGAEPVLSPKPITKIPSGFRLVLRLDSRSHYLQQIAFDDNEGKNRSVIYRYEDSGKLGSLPLPDGSRRSLYGENGLIDASGRNERFLLWPYGIASPGAMREWGTHAIAFIGKRHFDDPFLFEKLLARK